tara:strand:- start:305 stop:928 length:624 start_codon:yes stop_codon:yes gene_type:complete
LKKLLIIGAGGHCRSVLSAAKSMKTWKDYKIIDINFSNPKEKIMGCNVYPFDNLDDFSEKNFDFFIAIGDNKVRKSVFNNIRKSKCNFVNIIHSKAYIDNDSILGIGNFIGQFSNIGACAKIGDFNIINTYGNIEHEVVVGNFNHLAPSSTICGRTKLKDGIFIGTKAVIIDKLSIASNTTIGAGAVVLDSVDQSNKKLVGIPARVL